jgi:transcriptional regulator with XRE-family HTH domain
MVTSAQIRAARSLIGFSQGQVAHATGLSIPTIKRAESEMGLRASRTAIDTIRNALEIAGVIFLSENGEGAGVRLRKFASAEGLRPEELNATNDD